MSRLQRFIHRTQKTTPAIFSHRFFSTECSNQIGEKTENEKEGARLLEVEKRRYFWNIVDIKQHDGKAKLLGFPPAARSGKKPQLLGCSFMFASSPPPSMFRPSIFLTRVAELSSLSAATTTETIDAFPVNSKSEAAAERGEANGGNDSNASVVKGDNMSFAEAKRLMRLVNVEALKMKLGMEGKEMICYSELLEACKAVGVARTDSEAATFAQVLDEAGVILLFRDKVYLYPDKVVDLVRRAIPLALTAENDPEREELTMLQKRKEEIDIQAHQQVRRILWAGLGLSVMQVSLFFRLTFWEFSWDVMEPIAFFATATGIVVGYAYFLYTSRDPSYQDLRKRLFNSRQRKLFIKYKFDIDRLLELERKCKSPLDIPRSI